MKNVLVIYSTVCHLGGGAEFILPIKIHSVKCPVLPLSDTEVHINYFYAVYAVYAVWANVHTCSACIAN